MKAIFGFIVKHKILSIIALSAATLVSGGIIAFNAIMGNVAKPPEMETPPESFEYFTLSSLKDEFAVSDEEKARTIDSYSSEEGFSVYKRSFYNFLNTEKYRVITTGYTDVDTMGGILVNIKNEKKFDGTNFFMHLKSMADKENAFPSLSNNDAMHYLYVTGDNSKNLATVKNLDVKDPNVVKRKVVFTEKDYVYNYGAIPYIACNFIIRDYTVSSSSLSFDAETGLYKIEMTLDAVPATEGLVKQMHAVSGTDASYENGSVSYTAYVDESFVIRRADIKETYQVSTMGLKFNGVSETRDDFYYEGDESFLPLTEDEKYDINDIPIKANDEVSAYSKKVSKEAVEKVKSEGVNADFTLFVSGMSLTGRIQITFGDETLIKLDTEYNGVPVSLCLSLDRTKSGTIIAEINGFKAGLAFERIGDVIGDILPAFGVDFGGMNVGAIIDLIDISGLIDAFGNIGGSEISENVYKFEPNLNKTGIPLDIPLKMTVENGRIISFGIDNEEVMGKKIYFFLTPSEKEKDLSAPSIDETVADLSGFSDYAVKNVNLATVSDIIANKCVKFDLNAEVNGFAIIGDVAVEFSELTAPVVFANLNVDGMDLSLFFSDGTVFLKSGNVAVSLTVDELLNYVSTFTGDLKISSTVKELKNSLSSIINSAIISEYKFSLNYKNLAADLTAGKLSLSYGDKISAEISDISVGSNIIAPEGNFVRLSGLKPLLEKINTQLSTRHFTANGSVSFGNTAVRFENVKIINEGNLKDPTEAFDNGDLTLSGTLYITSGGKTHKLFVQYVNATLYVVYNNEMKIKLSRSSLDYIVDLIKNNYKAIIERFNYSEIISADDTLAIFKDYKFSIGSVSKLLQLIEVENGSIGITLKAEDFGFTDSAVLRAYLSDGNLALDVGIGDKSGSVSLDNTPFEKPAAPTGGFTDLSGINGLAKAAVNAILKPSETYYLSGSARVVIPILGIIDIDVNINMDASVRLVPDGNGGKKIEAVAHVSCYDTTIDISLARSYLKCGEGTLVYKDETFYITRVNKERKRIFGFPSSTWETKSTTRRAMTRSYFGKNIMSQIGFFMGLGDDILSKFSSGGNTQIEKCLKSYTATAKTHTIVLDGNALTGSSELGNMTLDIGITNNELTSLKVDIPISVSILDMTATVNLTHNPSQKGTYTDINNLKPSLFGTVLK